MRKSLLPWSIAVLLAILVSTGGQAQTGPITFGLTQIENDFPFGLTFTASAASTAGDIVSAKLIHHIRNATSATQAIVEVAPGREVSLSYAWDTSQITVPPSVPIFYHWEVVDSQGNRASSEEALVYYDDLRFDWQIREKDNFAVWWHDQPTSLGEEVYNTTLRALEEQRDLFQAELEFPIRIIVYNNEAEFATWHSFVSEFIGGQAFPSMGITTQIIPAAGDQGDWINDVIPHEISHLYFYQVTANVFSKPPAWLNEGVAEFNEFNDHQAALNYARRVIHEGGLIPLTALTGSFGIDEQKVRLSYAESLSAVTYLVETYGQEGMGTLLATYKRGLRDDQAFLETFGRNVGDFEQEWLAWMGIPQGMYGTPTPEPTLSIPPSPTMMQLPTSVGQRGPTASPGTKGPPTPSPTPEATAVALAPDTPQEELEPARRGRGLCASGAMVLLFGCLPLRWNLQKRRQGRGLTRPW